MAILDMIILTCAIWYVSFAITQLDGPFMLFSKIRSKVGGLFNCIYCLSFWVAIVLYAMLYNGIEEPVHILGVCGLAHILASYTGANYHDNGQS